MQRTDVLRERFHGARDFLRELVIITVGLLIALALNDLVESRNHRQLVRTAEASLRTEIESNSRTLADIRNQIAIEQRQLDDDLSVLSRLRSGNGKSKHEKLGFEFRISDFDDTAWKTAQTTGAFGYMPYGDVERFSTLYGTQATVYQTEQQAVDDVLKAAAIVITTPSGAVFTPDQIDETTRRIGEAKMHLIYLNDLIESLDHDYRQHLTGAPQRANHAGTAPTPSRS